MWKAYAREHSKSTHIYIYIAIENHHFH
jgi:hypothetical protein